MAKQLSDVSAHYDVGAVVQHSNPARAHPHDAVPTRVARESGFAGPGLDVPAERQRAARDAGSSHDHPVNRPVADDDRSLIGPQLGRGGTEGPRLAPVAPSTVYGPVDAPMQKFTKDGDVAAANKNFEDVSDLLMRPRGGASAVSSDGDENE